MKAIAYRYWSQSCPVFYVANVKGRIGDWGYTTDVSKALPLSLAQQARFSADCRAAGVTAQFVDAQFAGAEA
jgi:hypothetical protein